MEQRNVSLYPFLIRLKIYLFIILAISFAPVSWACGVKHHHRVCSYCCYKPHYKKHHSKPYCSQYKYPRSKQHYWRTTNYTTVTVTYPSCVCSRPRRSSCCGNDGTGYDVYYSVPDYGSDWNDSKGVVNYDPPNENPYRDDINGDYNLTY
jgi:hypothetical protein